MTDKATITALAERCEAANGQDRELDLAICVALNTGRSTDPRNPGADRYTASLDAAMTLPPADYLWRVLPADNNDWLASCWPHGGEDCDEQFARAATPALALTAACLRAIAGESQ